MATVGSPLDQSANLETDFSAIWKIAINRYEAIAMVKIQSLAGASSVDEVLSEIHDKETKFKSFRHDGSKLDKLRTIIKKSLAPIEALSSMVVNVTSMTYPPNEAIFRAICYLILITNSVSADYDKIAEFFEELDSYLQRLKVLEHNLPPFHELKMALAEVLTSVLILCAISVKYIKKNRIVKAFRNLTGEDKELTTAYARFHKTIERERVIVENAIVVRVEQIKKDTDALQADIKSGLVVAERVDRRAEIAVANTAQIRRHLETKESTVEREKLLKWLSPLNFDEKLNAALDRHQNGTGQWLLDAESFQQWFEGEQNVTLWCPGDPGTGKTVMLSLVVRYAEEHTEKNKACIACVYCDYKDPRTQSVVELLSSIIRQLAEQCTPIPPEVKAFREKYIDTRIHPTAEDQIPLIESISSLFERTYIFIDALDECSEATRDEFLGLAGRLEPFVRFFITSRPHVLLQNRFAHVFRLDIIARDFDIQTYLEGEMSKNRKMSKFLARDPSLKADILEKVNKKAGGMFLLAHLQIVHICEQTTVREVRKALSALPTGVYAFYDNAMTRIENQADKSVQLAKKALSYLYCAKRPLTWKELCHALALESGDVELDNAALHDEETVLNSSAGLIRIDAQSKITTLVHYTLQEYLTKYPEKLLPEPEVELAKACLIYLSFDTFQSGPCGDGDSLEQRLEMYHFLDYAAHYWGHHMINNQEMDLLMNFLRDEQKISSSVQVLYIPHFRRKGWQDRFPNSFSPIHVCAFWGLDKMLATLCKDGRDLDYQDSHGTTALHLASQHGHLETVRFLVESDATIDIINNRGETALSLAARNGYTTAVEFLLANGADAMVNDYEQWSALEWAVIGGFNNVIEVLLKHIVKNDMEGNNLSNSLVLAAEVGDNEAVQLLLDSGADIECKDYLGYTALPCAGSEGHEGTVRVLLENGANANIVYNFGLRPLHLAIQHESIARLLLDNGADINAISHRQQTALFFCAQDGSEEVLKTLLQRGADIHAQDEYGVTALHAAALKGREAMAHLLLEYHADPDKQDNDHWTPLHAAIFAGHDGLVRLLLPNVEDGLQIVADVTSRMKNDRRRARMNELVEIKSPESPVGTGLHGAILQVPRLLALLEAGADIDAEDISGHTALTLASRDDLEDCVRLLLENGADVNKAGRNGRMPLHCAVMWGRENIVKMLVECDADINADIYFWTPILMAAEMGFTSKVEYLAEKGADVNAKNYNLRTALHYVSNTGSAKIAQLLIDKGAHVNIVDQWEKSPLEYAIESGNDEVKEVLQRSGAKIKSNAQRDMTKYSRQ